jgi:hypothetical protein
MSVRDLLGYAAAGAVLAGFCMNSIRHLRMVAIASNGLFILYGLSAHIHPVVILHMILLPINVMKLHNIRPEACAAEPRPLAMAPEEPRMTMAALVEAERRKAPVPSVRFLLH